MAPDADIPFAPGAHLAALNAFYRRRRALKATLAGRPVTMATTSPTRGSDDVTDRYVVDLKIDAAEGSARGWMQGHRDRIRVEQGVCRSRDRRWLPALSRRDSSRTPGVRER
jgi:hypothetical protein